jgi:hypothetical protein
MVFKKPEEDNPEHPPIMTGGQIKHAIEKAGLKTLMYLSSTETEVFLLIGATEERLEIEAEQTEYSLKLNSRRALDAGNEIGFTLARVTVSPDELTKTITTRAWDNMYGRFNKEVRHIYETYTDDGPCHKDSVFTTIDRLKLTLMILESDPKVGGAGLSMVLSVFN